MPAGLMTVSIEHDSSISPRSHWAHTTVFMLWYVHRRKPPAFLSLLSFSALTEESDTCRREFFYLVGYATDSFDKMEGNAICKQIDWDENEEFYRAWDEARTGFPWIDAIMKQLHEQVRHIRTLINSYVWLKSVLFRV